MSFVKDHRIISLLDNFRKFSPNVQKGSVVIDINLKIWTGRYRAFRITLHIEL